MAREEGDPCAIHDNLDNFLWRIHVAFTIQILSSYCLDLKLSRTEVAEFKVPSELISTVHQLFYCTDIKNTHLKK
jgi:hypothetical protein